MTKSKMLDFIEKTGMIIDFDRNYLMKQSKDKIQGFYERAKIYESHLFYLKKLKKSVDKIKQL